MAFFITIFDQFLSRFQLKMGILSITFGILPPLNGPIVEQKNPAYQHKISDSTLFKIHTFSFLTGSIVFTQRRPGF